MVWFARVGTCACGLAGAKGGRGTDCREGPEDGARGEKETETTGENNSGEGERYVAVKHVATQNKSNCENILLTINMMHRNYLVMGFIYLEHLLELPSPISPTKKKMTLH